MRPRLLIVEDDASLREVWEVIFGSRGWDVASASTVAEGLALLDPPPDYLILDLGLPDAGGEVILRRVRDAGFETRVAVTTGSDDAQPTEQGQGLEARGVVREARQRR